MKALSEVTWLTQASRVQPQESSVDRIQGGPSWTPPDLDPDLRPGGSSVHAWGGGEGRRPACRGGRGVAQRPFLYRDHSVSVTRECAPAPHPACSGSRLHHTAKLPRQGPGPSLGQPSPGRGVRELWGLTYRGTRPIPGAPPPDPVSTRGHTATLKVRVSSRAFGGRKCSVRSSRKSRFS